MHGLPSPPPLDPAGVAILAVAALIALALYFLPTIVAYRKQKANRAAIFAVNLFLGWTFLGWLFALIWALKVDAVDIIARHRAMDDLR